jgi:hypothetical protein
MSGDELELLAAILLGGVIALAGMWLGGRS